MAWHGIDAFETLEADLWSFESEGEIEYTMGSFKTSIAPFLATDNLFRRYGLKKI